MANDIVHPVKIVKSEPRSSSWVIKDGFGIEHRAIVRLIKKYRAEFEEFGLVITTPLHLPGVDKPITEYWLNESQALYLGTLLTNSDRVRSFKRLLVKDYARCKKLLQQRQNAEWIEARNAGKRLRKQETDGIKAFVEYAKGQGSQNAERYYANISKMENKALFLVEQKYPNLRDVLGVAELGLIAVADTIVLNALTEGMERAFHYKDIYKLAKERVEALGAAHGRLPVPAPQLFLPN